jgi:hypothetical protein
MAGGQWSILRHPVLNTCEHDGASASGAGVGPRARAPRAVEFKYSRHGPIFFEDAKNRRAYALRSVMNEPGTGAYLGGLRLSQARDCREFLEAALTGRRRPKT